VKEKKLKWFYLFYTKKKHSSKKYDEKYANEKLE
jgi:hypothetical protein